ncbi:MAG: type II toxin-antitoxin system RelE/ParE family toxin [Candidatus Paceibacterota bacterium]|jgi:mRNA-degrading endonuclease RelE of RelBE toxin-antitoxin system
MKIGFSLAFSKIVKQLAKKDKKSSEILLAHCLKISENPTIGKPLRNVLKNCRRVHIDSRVLLYEIAKDEVRFLDFDHHDKIYKKYEKQ